MNVEMYTKKYCPYCGHARALMKRYEVGFVEYDVTGNSDKISEMIDRSLGRWTVPQIFINGAPIGGCDDLYTLHLTDQLGKMLGQEAAVAPYKIGGSLG